MCLSLLQRLRLSYSLRYGLGSSLGDDIMPRLAMIKLPPRSKMTLRKRTALGTLRLILSTVYDYTIDHPLAIGHGATWTAVCTQELTLLLSFNLSCLVTQRQRAADLLREPEASEDASGDPPSENRSGSFAVEDPRESCISGYKRTVDIQACPMRVW